jgi:vacuolar iron transporter family protein
MSSSERYRQRLDAERDAAAVYRALAARRHGEEHELLIALAQAEERHAAHWAHLLDEPEVPPHRLGLRARILSWLARRVGSLLVLSLVQRAELRDTYSDEPDATPVLAADERVHARVVGALARRRRARASGTFRAAIFGINDGLVSNLSLVLGVAGAGVAPTTVLITGLAGLLSGALSMAAGEYVSVRSQRELIHSRPPRLGPETLGALRGADSHELALAFQAEGMSKEYAEQRAGELLEQAHLGEEDLEHPTEDVVGTAAGAATSSFASFAIGASLPVLPFFFLTGAAAELTATVIAAIALFAAGAAAAVLSGGPVLIRGLRQLAIGMLAAAITYGVGNVFGVVLD